MIMYVFQPKASNHSDGQSLKIVLEIGLWQIDFAFGPRGVCKRSDHWRCLLAYWFMGIIDCIMEQILLPDIAAGCVEVGLSEQHGKIEPIFSQPPMDGCEHSSDVSLAPATRMDTNLAHAPDPESLSVADDLLVMHGDVRNKIPFVSRMTHLCAGGSLK